jgi:hypothetical protein
VEVEVFDQKVEGPSNYHRTVSRGTSRGRVHKGKHSAQKILGLGER